MTAAVVAAAAVLLVECATHVTTSSPPSPSTYRPAWSSTVHVAPPIAATHEAEQPVLDPLQHVALRQPLGPSRGRPQQGTSSGGATRPERVVLQEEVYEGENRLVYRLAPGAIFAGVRTASLTGPSQVERSDTRGGADAKPPKMYSGKREDTMGKPVKESREPPGSVAASWTATHPDIQSHRRPQPSPHRPPRRWAPLARLRETLATLSTASLGAVRGFHIIVMLAQHMGFLPDLPGFPKYGKPADHRRPSTTITLERGGAGDL